MLATANVHTNMHTYIKIYVHVGMYGFLCIENTVCNVKKSIDQLRKEVEAIFNNLYGMYVKCNLNCMYVCV